MNSNRLKYWLAAHYLPAMGLRTLFKCVNYFGDIEQFFNAPLSKLNEAGLNSKLSSNIVHFDWKVIDYELSWANQKDNHILCFEDDAYPKLLKEITDPPPVLYIKGDPNVLQMPQVALVGSRHASTSGLKNAESLASFLAQAGFAITSGLAKGVDAAAHLGALKVVGGRTIAVLGTGMLHIYPKQNIELAQSIVKSGGALVSEFHLKMPPQAKNFPRRNRVISGLSLGIVVVEAAVRSGSLITARYGLEQNREIFAVPGSIHQSLHKGCHFLIKQGAKLIETGMDILEELQPGSMENENVNKRKIPVEKKNTVLLDQDHQIVYDCIQYERTSIDAIILNTGLTNHEISSILLALEMQGLIESMPGGYTRLD